MKTISCNCMDGLASLPKDKNWKDRCLAALQNCLNCLNFSLIGYRPVPVDPAGLGESALATEPDMVQVFVRHAEGLSKLELERKLFLLRNFATREVHRQLPEEQRDYFYFASLSYKTVVYKGQLTTWQLPTYFPDLRDERHRPHPFPLLDQHFSQVEAGATLPLRRPQRRNQHPDRQPKLVEIKGKQLAVRAFHDRRTQPTQAPLPRRAKRQRLFRQACWK